MTEEKLKLAALGQDNKWHSWKCRCGCLNNRGIATCGRCGGLIGIDSMFYGSDGYVAHYGIWEAHELAKRNQSLPKH